MTEVERGVVTHEFRRLQSDQQILESLREPAENLLAAQAACPPDIMARGWDELDTDEQAAVGDELLEIPRLGWTFTFSEVMASGLSMRGTRRVVEALEEYHDSLPFTKSERFWLADTRWQALQIIEEEQLSLAVVHWVMNQRDEIVVLGKHQTVSGAELVRREWDWMRGAGAYNGNSTYDDATRVALQGIVNLFDERG